jgi:hypothetical protein
LGRFVDGRIHLHQSSRGLAAKRGNRFPLSSEERAGVRTDKTPFEKAVEGRKYSKTLPARGATIIRASVLECASPLALWNGGTDFSSTRRMEGNTVEQMIKDLVFRKVAPKIATPQDIATLEAKLGVKLPPTFHEFCFRWNGGYPSKENECYIIPSSFTEFYEKYTFGKKTEGVAVQVGILLAATEEFKSCNLMHEYQLCVAGGKEPKFIPIATNLMGDLAVLRADSPMRMVYWFDRDTFEMPEGVEWGTTPGNPEARPALMPIAESLEEFYNALTSDPED